MAFVPNHTVVHWSDKHILRSPAFGSSKLYANTTWRAYDEAGQFMASYPTLNEARQALIAYGDHL